MDRPGIAEGISSTRLVRSLIATCSAAAFTNDGLSSECLINLIFFELVPLQLQRPLLLKKGFTNP